MKYEIVNEDVRYLRNECPISCFSVTGTGPGECKCCPDPEPPPPPAPPPPRCCATRVVVRNSGTYLVSSNGSVMKVCC